MVMTIKRVCFLTGGILANAVRFMKIAGNLNNWGAFLPYVASYFYSLNNSVKSSDLSIVPSIGYTIGSLVPLLISNLASYISIFNQVLIFSTVFGAGLFFSSFITNAMFFSWVFGICIGCLCSSLFLPSLWLVWNELPDKKSLTSGILLSGYSLGAVPFSLMFTFIVNPYNIKAETGSEDEKMFPKEVAERVPMTIRWVTTSFLIITYLALFLLPRKGKIQSHEVSESSTTSLKEMLMNKRFWLLFGIMYLVTVCVGYAFFYYKIIAIQFINDDYYSAFVGTAAFFLCGIGRTLFGYLLSRMYWKKIMSLVYFLSTLLMTGMWFTLNDKRLYAFFMVSYHFLMSSFYTNVLILTEEAFPGNKNVISCVCMSFIPAFFTPFLMSKYLEPTTGVLGSFLILAGCTLIVFFLILFYRDSEKKDPLI